MCGNRVEELETRVQELEASVEGLTDELVECKVRIRELENTVDEDNGISRPSAGVEAEAEAAAGQSEGPTDAAGPESAEDEILPPEADTPNTEAPDEGDNTTAEPESETDDESETDIIVA
jgi:chromosome segregation ATPase